MDLGWRGTSEDGQKITDLRQVAMLDIVD